MENNYFTKSSRYWKIGNFGIEYSREMNNIRFEIPASGMAFYQTEQIPKTFQLQIVNVEKNKNGHLIFGSADFSIPTFLYQYENGEFDWITKKKDGSPAISFRISDDWNKFSLYEDETGTNGVEAFHEFGSLFSYAVLNYHACVLHGVVMEYNGMGILVTAPAGTGKTTHTRMWRDRENALIINGDRCLCRFIDGRWYAYGMPWSGSSGEYINRRVPITAIVCLKRAKENMLHHMSVFEGTLAMMQRIYAPLWKCKMQNAAFDMCEELATEIPILELSCRPDYEAVDVLKEAILKLKE